MVFIADLLSPAYCEAKLRDKSNSSRPTVLSATSSTESVPKDTSRGDPPSPPPQPPPSPSNGKRKKPRVALEKDVYGMPAWY